MKFKIKVSFATGKLFFTCITIEGVEIIYDNHGQTFLSTLYILSCKTHKWNRNVTVTGLIYNSRLVVSKWIAIKKNRKICAALFASRLYQLNSFLNRMNRASWRDEIFCRYSRLIRVIWTGLELCRDSFQENRSLKPRMKNKETRRGISDLVVSWLSGRKNNTRRGREVRLKKAFPESQAA